MKTYVALSLFVSLLMVSSCSKDDNGDPDDNNNLDCSTIDVTYNQGIKAILDTHCALPTCHGGDPSIPDYTTYDGVFALRALIRTRVVAKTMPPAGSMALSQDNINKISCWVENGAPQ